MDGRAAKQMGDGKNNDTSTIHFLHRSLLNKQPNECGGGGGRVEDKTRGRKKNGVGEAFFLFFKFSHKKQIKCVGVCGVLCTENEIIGFSLRLKSKKHLPFEFGNLISVAWCWWLLLVPLSLPSAYTTLFVWLPCVANVICATPF